MSSYKVGETFGDLTVVDVTDASVICKCACGNTKEFSNWLMEYREPKTCGCYMSRYGSKLIPKTHGLSKTPEYSIWKAMRRRCNKHNDPHYANYGGRGIKVCEEWNESFESFISDVGFRPDKSYTLDRIDNDGNYEPGNVRWATRMDNQNNRRNTVYIEYNGQNRTLREWSEVTGIPFKTLNMRYRRGKTLEEVFNPNVKVNKVTMVTYQGRTQSTKQWCEELGLPVEPIRCRINRGWSAEDAFNTPVR